MWNQLTTWLNHFSTDKIFELLSYDAKAPILFNSGLFLWLFAGFILLYYLLKHQQTARLLFVTCFSYYFYYKSSGFYFFLLFVITFSDFFIAHFLHKTKEKYQRKLLVTLSLCINLGLLCYFKYTNFFGDTLSQLLNFDFKHLDIFLPVGISFFTFQSLSYTIDVYRKKITPLNRFLDYAFYVSFFPQLVAGPIVRACDFIPQIRRPLYVSHEMFGRGLFMIISGLFKKVIISDFISLNFVDRIFDNPSLYSGLENLLGIYGYALQIYCDFAGYSDMAIGIALLLGFKFNINFDSPYQSSSVTEFWRRWHISLSTWLRDYLYISLGGNRKGKFRQYINLIITMFLGGLWHGASLNFILWGMLHGIALAFHKMWQQITHKAKSFHSTGLKRIGGIVITFHFVCFCWIFFRNEDFNNSIAMIQQIALNFHLDLLPQIINGYWQPLSVILLGYGLHFLPKRSEDLFCSLITRSPLVLKALIMTLFIYCLIQIRSTDVQPFIYFQF